MRRFTYAVFETEEVAAAAIKEVVLAGFAPSAIRVLMRRGDEVTEVAVNQKDRIALATGIGGAVGATLGVAGATLVATSSAIAPGIGLVAAGPIAAALEGALAGGVGGTLVGAVSAIGNWDTKADFPRDDIERGGIVVAILASPERRRIAAAALTAAGGNEVRAFVADQIEDVREAIS